MCGSCHCSRCFRTSIPFGFKNVLHKGSLAYTLFRECRPHSHSRPRSDELVGTNLSAEILGMATNALSVSSRSFSLPLLLSSPSPSLLSSHSSSASFIASGRSSKAEFEAARSNLGSCTSSHFHVRTLPSIVPQITCKDDETNGLSALPNVFHKWAQRSAKRFPRCHVGA